MFAFGHVSAMLWSFLCLNSVVNALYASQLRYWNGVTKYTIEYFQFTVCNFFHYISEANIVLSTPLQFYGHVSQNFVIENFSDEG